MFSTLVGRSGREYKIHRMLQHNPSKPEFDICLASSNGFAFITKPVPRPVLELLQELRTEFKSQPRLRFHIDEVEKEDKEVVIFECFRSDLLALTENNPPLPLIAKKKILKEVGLALADMHAKNWIHLDVKPNNVFVNWHADSNDEFHLGEVVLGDLDCALHLQGDKLLNHRMGNVMWRSPEGQLGRGVGKASEVFSFALLCLYVLRGVQYFNLDFEGADVEPEELVLLYMLLIFGPLPDAFIKHVNNEEAEATLNGLSQLLVNNELEGDFMSWTEDMPPDLDNDARKLIMRMTHLDPARRAPMSDIMTDPYWNTEQ